ncbi:MAG: heparin lyase I family protein [Myxococcaceae bacterium]|nr:heparin lyase I family protein [Myxococcaceae bacterium]
MQRSTWVAAATAAALTVLAFSTPAMAEVVWRGDFETGNRSQWDKEQLIAADRAQVVSSPTRQGRYALRVEVRKGDDPIRASGNRNELVKFDGSSEGTEYYYGWSTLWPADYPMTPNWQVFMQWHHSGNNGAPPVRLVLGCSAADCGQALPDTLFFIVNGKTQWTMKGLTRDQWHDFVLHIKWSANPNVGFVELWYDGQLVVPKRYVRTMFDSSGANYLKMGLYRDAATQPTAVLFHDGFVQATTLEEAMPSARSGGEEAPDSGAPQAPGSSQDTGSAPGSGASPGGLPGSEAAPGGEIIQGGPEGDSSEYPQAMGCSAGASAVTAFASLAGAAALLLLTRRRRGSHRRG